MVYGRIIKLASTFNMHMQIYIYIYCSDCNVFSLIISQKPIWNKKLVLKLMTNDHFLNLYRQLV